MANGILTVFFRACFLFLSVGCESNGTGSSAEGGGVLVGAGGTTLCLGVLPGFSFRRYGPTVFSLARCIL